MKTHHIRLTLAVNSRLANGTMRVLHAFPNRKRKRDYRVFRASMVINGGSYEIIQ
jgi:hypothetical protein